MKVKSHDRKMNKLARLFNQSIEKDELWRGRFVLRQVRKKCYRYNDGSGYESSYLYAIIDKKTGIYDLDWFHNYSWKSEIWRFINDFIIKTVDVWHENPQPSRETAIDYSKKPFPKIYSYQGRAKYRSSLI